MTLNIMRAALVLFTVLGTAPAVAQSLSRADRPEVKVGDRSVYQERNVLTGAKRETSFVVTMVDADKIVSETGLSTSGAWTFTRDWNLVERKRGDTVAASVTPYWPYLQFPLEVGKTWETPFDIDVTVPSGKRHAKWRWKARVVGVEAVTVPAGTFQVLKIEAEGTYASREGRKSWTGSHKETIWYAPDVNRMVKREYEQSAPANDYRDHRVVELLSFKLAP